MRDQDEFKREQKKKSLKYSIVDGSAHSVMEGFGNSFIVPFALALKASTTMVGVISSLPELIGAVFQLTSTAIADRVKSRKKIIVLSAFLHALVWLPLFFVPLLMQEYGPLFVLVFVTIKAMLSYIINPFWNSLMGDLVPEDERGRYFGRRNMITGACVFTATFVAGYLLNALSGIHFLLGFGVLFGIAFVSRIVSAIYLNKMHDVEYAVDKKVYFSFFDFVKRMSQNNYGKFTLYLCLFNFVVFLAAPFFTVYMLRDLKFSYITFTTITLASLVASFIGMYFWGRYNDEHGSKKLLYINGLLIPLIPILWLFTKNIYLLILIEAFSGFLWAGFNLGSSNFIFDATTPQKRMRCVVYYNVLKGAAIFAGAAIGGLLATHIGSFGFVSPLPVLFLISGVLRLAVSLMFIPVLREMRFIEVPMGHSMFRTYLTIKPKEGIVYETIGTHPHPINEKDRKNRKLMKPPPGRLTSSDSSQIKQQKKPETEKEKTNKQLVGYLQSEMKKKK